MNKVVAVDALPGFRLRLRFSDGVEGMVDLSDYVGSGVFKAWEQSGVFESVAIGSAGELAWGDTIDLCPDALYLQVTKKKPEDLFPNLKKVEARA